MTEYAICFDFPEGGDPWFASKTDEGLALTTRFDSALTFTSDLEAEMTLAHGYGTETRKFGTVVEVGQ